MTGKRYSRLILAACLTVAWPAWPADAPSVKPLGPEEFSQIDPNYNSKLKAARQELSAEQEQRRKLEQEAAKDKKRVKELEQAAAAEKQRIKELEDALRLAREARTEVLQPSTSAAQPAVAAGIVVNSAGRFTMGSGRKTKDETERKKREAETAQKEEEARLQLIEEEHQRRLAAETLRGGQEAAAVERARQMAQAKVQQGGGQFSDGRLKGTKQPDPRLKDPSNILSKRSVYFDRGKHDVSDEYKPIVEAHANYLRSNPDANIIVIGNSDEQDSRESNVAMGHRRAENVRKMMNRLGVSDKQIETVSFGEEKPRATCHEEMCWAENRRSDIVYQGE